MTQTCRHDRQCNTRRQQLCRYEMTKIMQTEMVDTSMIQRNSEPLARAFPYQNIGRAFLCRDAKVRSTARRATRVALSFFPQASGGVRQHDAIDPLISAEIEEVRIGAGERRAVRTGSLGRDAVGQADRTVSSVIVTRPQHAGRDRHRCIDRYSIGEFELSDVQRCVVFGNADQTDEMINDLSGPESGQTSIVVSTEQLRHQIGCWLTFEQCQHGVCVENDQRVLRRSASPSEARARRRARSVDGPLDAYLPTNSLIASSPVGRMTMRSPRSMTTTRSVCHRLRAAAGIDT